MTDRRKPSFLRWALFCIAVGGFLIIVGGVGVLVTGDKSEIFFDGLVVGAVSVIAGGIFAIVECNSLLKEGRNKL